MAEFEKSQCKITDDMRRVLRTMQQEGWTNRLEMPEEDSFSGLAQKPQVHMKVAVES